MILKDQCGKTVSVTDPLCLGQVLYLRKTLLRKIDKATNKEFEHLQVNLNLLQQKLLAFKYFEHQPEDGDKPRLECLR
jgi:hypothetical protein